MKSCQNCYYCFDSNQFAGDWWGACSNSYRLVEAHNRNHYWGRSHLNLKCWRGEDPLNDARDSPDYSELVVIRPARKLKRISRMSRFYSNKYVTTPWSYVLRSRIASVFRKDESSRQMVREKLTIRKQGPEKIGWTLGGRGSEIQMVARFGPQFLELYQELL